MNLIDSKAQSIKEINVPNFTEDLLNLALAWKQVKAGSCLAMAHFLLLVVAVAGLCQVTAAMNAPSGHYTKQGECQVDIGRELNS